MQPGRALVEALSVAGALALLSLPVGLRLLSAPLLAHILVPGSQGDLQEITDGVPVPRVLDWNQSWLDVMTAIRDSHGLLLVLPAALIAGLGAWLLLVVLNPTALRSRMSAPAVDNGDGGPDADGAAQHRAVRHPGKLIPVLIAVSIPVVAIWVLSGLVFGAADLQTSAMSLLSQRIMWGARTAAIGAGAWMGFSVYGLAGDLRQRELGGSPMHRPELFLAGLGAGIAICAIWSTASTASLDVLLRLYQMLGTFNAAYAHDISVRYLGTFALAAFATGLTLYAFGRPGVSRVVRSALLALTALTVLGAVVIRRPLTPPVMAARYDITPAVAGAIPVTYSPARPASGVPDGPEAGAELAKRVHLPTAYAGQGRDVCIAGLAPRAVITVRQRGFTEDALSVDAATAAPVQQFLHSRSYRTALSWVATKHLFNVAAYHFDPSGMISCLIDDLAAAPHYAQCTGPVRQLLFTCAATPANRALLDRWADETSFAYPDRESRRLIGDLYVRFGDMPAALRWYRKADMPRTFQRRVASEMPLFHSGVVTGRLLWNGRPLAGQQVAVAPIRLNGLPRDLEPMVLHSPGEIVNEIPDRRFRAFPRLHPRPWNLRWISASTTTDAEGRFRIDSLTEGQYFLLFALPRGFHPQLGFDPRLKLTSLTPPIDLHYATPAVDLGTLAIHYSG